MSPLAGHASRRYDWVGPLSAIRRWVVLLALLAGLSLRGAAPAQAQQAVSLASLEISLWPEFDKPSVLVILNGQVAPGVALPASLSIHIPAAAGAPNAVALVGTGGGLFQTPYTTSQAGGDIIIAFTTTSTGFRVEYYDPALKITGEGRSFGWRWTSDTAIQAATVSVQQPFDARGLAGQPALVAAGAGEYGLNYYTASLGAIAAGGTLAFDLTYSKTGAALSATEVANTSAGASVPAGTPIVPVAASSTTTSSQPWIIVGVVAALILAGGAVAWYVRFSPISQGQGQGQASRRRTNGYRGNEEPEHPALTRRRTAPTRARATTTADAGASAEPAVTKSGSATTVQDEPARFCPQCGQRYQSGDHFCRRCGAPVRE